MLTSLPPGSRVLPGQQGHLPQPDGHEPGAGPGPGAEPAEEQPPAGAQELHREHQGWQRGKVK